MLKQGLMMNTEQLCKLADIELSLIAARARFEIADCEDDLDIAADALDQVNKCGFDYGVLTVDTVMPHTEGLERKIHESIERMYFNFPQILVNAFDGGCNDAKH